MIKSSACEPEPMNHISLTQVTFETLKNHMVCTIYSSATSLLMITL